MTLFKPEYTDTSGLPQSIPAICFKSFVKISLICLTRKGAVQYFIKFMFANYISIISATRLTVKAPSFRLNGKPAS